ncbi:SpaA isopeptide-forming pilin-related protein [Clostridium sp. D53t1_180928_C8]|uniref:SpaA isopeptide-forming pilin-related protein n=1 Tax=Clostridium sp. D53t1_180928_C8 TaxID=2787101 RepID=UPI0018AAFD27|nr:SpaA isopeptide-forming pilin-related protein [Clostridium sp. D53t1_180928_C8]
MKGSNKKRSKNSNKTIRRNTVKKLIAILTAIFTILGLSTSIVGAEENESYDYTYVGVDTWGNTVSVNGGESGTALFKVQNPDGSISYAYCVDLDTLVKEGHNYSRVNVESSGYYDSDSAKHIRAIVRNAYPFINLETIASTLKLENLTKEEAIAATQLAIWKYANATQTPANLTGNVEVLYNYLINLDGVKGQTSVANIIAKDPIIHANNQGWDVEYMFKADGKNADGSSIALQYNIEGKPEGSEVIESGVDNEGYTHIKITNIKEDTNIKLVVLGVQDVGTDVFFYSPEGGRGSSQSLIGIQSGNTNISKSFEYKVQFGNVNIKKVDEANNEITLKDAEFTIKDLSGNVIKVITTNENGVASAKLVTGSYTIEETKAPSGYLIVNGKQQLTIEPGQTEGLNLVFTNKKDRGSVVLTKVDSEDNAKTLSGVEYELYDNALNKISDCVTGEDGKIAVGNLAPGRYFFIETKPLEGYVQDFNRLYFNIESNQQVALEITAQNKKIKGSIEITKVNEKEEPLKNAEFVIKNESGEVVSKAKTDEDGVVKFIELPYGKYIYQEITAPTGYVLDDTEHSFEIKEDGKIIKVSHTNKKEENKTTTTNRKPSNTTNTTNKKPSNPKTGEVGLAGVFGILILASGGLLINNRKKK